ncbi:hypothetical protein ATK78_2016 [Pedobacter metabolipauper]|uniref:Uncharacterized protein n=1 Tax=Pedobacter metabolipauper TaxID=425513 RepID=A0A4V3D1A2_9SPHI|nr:hypothetical protein ATK78_2016 [Pedobacter metabolipauper]
MTELQIIYYNAVLFIAEQLQCRDLFFFWNRRYPAYLSIFQTNFDTS